MTASLVHVDPLTDPGISRQRSGKGFRYLEPNGSAVDAATKERIVALVLPPAWTDVWICTDPDGHIQAIGTDAAGRRQYRYHPQWQHERAERKFHRTLSLAQVLPAARGRVTRDLRQSDDPRARMLAVSFRFLDDAAPRIGSIGYLEKYGSRGLTTLQQQDARVDGHRVILSFPAKEHKTDDMHMTDAELAEVVAELLTGEDEETLLRYEIDAKLHHLSETEVNEYIRTVTGEDFTAKDFRTLRGTVIAAESLARAGAADTKKAQHAAEVAAAKAASDALQNTPAVARASYIDPRVFEAYAEGRLFDLTVSPETALGRLVGGDAG